MTRISIDPSVHIVIVTVDADPQDLPRLQHHATKGLAAFGTYAGFIGGATHLSEDGSRLVQYLQWSSAEAYETCLNDPAWDEMPSTSTFMEAIRDGSARVDARAFRVVAVFP